MKPTPKPEIQPLTDPDDPRDIAERIDDLAKELMATAFYLCDQRREGGKIDKEEEAKLVDMQRLFKFINSTYNAMIKSGRLSARPNEHFGSEVLQRVKEKNSYIGAIVREIPKE